MTIGRLRHGIAAATLRLLELRGIPAWSAVPRGQSITTEDIMRDSLRRLTGGGGIAAPVSASAMAAVITGGWAPVAVEAQQASPAATDTARKAPAAKRSGKVLRAPDGKPDLHGTWSFASVIPFERPPEFGNKAVLTDAEAAAYAKNKVEQANKDRRDGSAAADVERAYNDFWWDFGTKASNRTSLIVDPPDGRLPARTAEAQLRLKNRRVSYENPEDRPLAERCILGFNSGPPDDSERLQQQRRDRPDRGPCGAGQRDDSQRPRRAHYRQPSAIVVPVSDRRLDRQVGR